MSVELLREYEEDGAKVTEYTRDGETVSHTVREPIVTVPPAPVEPQPTLVELQTQTLLNTEYLVTMSELSNLKGE
ncbi:hypothetical protein [Viridibacillus arvi]|uniref:hypothetical protein n=1 Tax=Viridibacillus arvi TaxID=263475 RepID=UPI00187B2BCF|nr:hypothetical protein [Viridibacillus sp. JNUCC-6]QOV10944.1 hypothetical protein JNUCC6_20645 [Viridibacillus sp. JNUCC-6]